MSADLRAAVSALAADPEAVRRMNRLPDGRRLFEEDVPQQIVDVLLALRDELAAVPQPEPAVERVCVCSTPPETHDWAIHLPDEDDPAAPDEGERCEPRFTYDRHNLARPECSVHGELAGGYFTPETAANIAAEHCTPDEDAHVADRLREAIRDGAS